CNPGKLFGTNDNKRDRAYYHQLGETDIEHAALPPTLWVTRLLTAAVFLAGLNVDGVVLDALGLDLCGRGFVVALFHAGFETAHGAAEVFTHVAQLFGAEHERHNEKND